MCHGRFGGDTTRRGRGGSGFFLTTDQRNERAPVPSLFWQLLAAGHLQKGGEESHRDNGSANFMVGMGIGTVRTAGPSRIELSGEANTLRVLSRHQGHTRRGTDVA